MSQNIDISKINNSLILKIQELLIKMQNKLEKLKVEKYIIKI